MVKRKIGILVFARKRKERGTTKYFDQERFLGFKRVIAEIDKKENSVEYISDRDIDKFDFVLCSITSWYDILNLLNTQKKKKPIFIVGGSGFLNVPIIYDYIDIGVFGRGENQINDILNGKYDKNVYVKKDDPEIEKEYEIGQMRELIDGETDIGCKRKCYFCQYGWKFKANKNKYDSGYNERETMFLDIDFNVSGRYLVSSIDCITESGRKRINKPLSNDRMLEKLMEINLSKKKVVLLKLYNIYGFPFEDARRYNYFEFEKVLREVDKGLNKKITILLNNTHFVPMPLTPMEGEPVNVNNFKSIKWRFNGKMVKCIKSNSATSETSAILQTISNRVDLKLRANARRLLLSTKFMSLTKYGKLRAIEKYLGKILLKTDSKILPYLKYPFKSKMGKAVGQ